MSGRRRTLRQSLIVFYVHIRRPAWLERPKPSLSGEFRDVGMQVILAASSSFGPIFSLIVI